MPIENRNLQPGTKLIATYKKETYHALVVAGTEGKVQYQLSPYDGREFKSPSSLGTAVTGKACNGWTFWSVDTSEAEAEADTATAQEPPSEVNTGLEEPELEEGIQTEDASGEEASQEDATAQPATAGFRRVPNQRGVPEGEVRLYCDACQASFTAPVGQQPDTCPQGHWPDDASSAEEAQS
ncbi:MAG TPA: hypothetical protein VFA32_00120 [Dehalococcoidia bacterium]|nr:hypothetical protein [Dehalococcoidia bacterium]